MPPRGDTEAVGGGGRGNEREAFVSGFPGGGERPRLRAGRRRQGARTHSLAHCVPRGTPGFAVAEAPARLPTPGSLRSSKVLRLILRIKSVHDGGAEGDVRPPRPLQAGAEEPGRREGSSRGKGGVIVVP